MLLTKLLIESHHNYNEDEVKSKKWSFWASLHQNDL